VSKREVIGVSTARLGGVRRDKIPSAEPPRAIEPESEPILRHLVDFLDAFMWQADPTTLEVTFVTKGISDRLGVPESSWLGGPDAWGTFIHAEDRQRVVEEIRATAIDGRDREIEFRAITGDGRTLVMRHVVRLIDSPSGEPELWGVTTDRTVEKQNSEMLRYAKERNKKLTAEADDFRRRALTDPLTGLPNRILFEDRLATALRAAERSGEPCAVLVMDLNRFKEINDTIGHQAGDTVLKQSALRFRVCLRAQDTPARLGGDEFAAVLPATDDEGAGRVAARIYRAIGEMIELETGELQIGTSIGIALWPQAGRDAESLIAAADVAMYRAKAEGGGVEYAELGQEMPVAVGPKRRSVRRMLIALAACLVMAALALTPIALHRSTPRDGAAELTAAVTALQTASSDEADAVADGIQRALEELSLNDASGGDVDVTLARLARLLRELNPSLRYALGPRVEQLLAATLSKANQVAKLATPGSLTVVKPKLRQQSPEAPRPEPAPARPSPVATPLDLPKLP
jgi:diguanylate cyclase (GGDEF)-like protein